MSSSSSARVVAAFLALGVALPAAAQWSTDPATPLVLGQTLGVGPAHRAVGTADGATWVAWIDDQCFPSLRVQRADANGIPLAGEPLSLDTQPDCVSLTAAIVAMPDNTVVVTAIGTSPDRTPVHRLSASGQDLWPPGVVSGADVGAVAALGVGAGGDALVAGFDMTTVYVQGYAPDGTPRWDSPAAFAPAGGSNRRIVAVVDDGLGGAFVVWDTPGAYTRRVYAMRIGSDGAATWSGDLLVVDIPPGSSRHTSPQLIADGAGGLVFVWTQGAESPDTPVPIRMQRISAAGALSFPMDGPRVSTSSARQFEPQALMTGPGGEVVVGWREGGFGAQEVRLQKMTLAGERLWGDTGVLVTPIAGPQSRFSVAWLAAGKLGIAVTDPPAIPGGPSVQLHRTDVAGNVSNAPWPLSGSVPAHNVAGVPLGDALAVIWQRDGSGLHSEIVAQRIDENGSLGAADTDGDGLPDPQDNCTLIANAAQRDTDADGYGNACDADFNNDCTVNAVDLGIMKLAFFGSDDNVDLNGDGVVNVLDLGLLRQRFFAAPGPSGVSDDCVT